MTDSSASNLHPLVSGFADAALYDRSRPAYGVEFARALCSRLELSAGDPVLELGAGTGQLSRALLEAGMELTAVEPLAGMCELLRGAIGADRVREGAAEAIPLPDRSVRAVFAADSFHWFDESRAMPEIRRVLSPGGGVAIARIAPSIDAPWTRELEPIFLAELGEHPAFGERSPAAALEEDPAFGEVSELTMTVTRPTDREGVLAYLASVSWIATLEERRRSAVLAAVEEVLERNGVVQVPGRLSQRAWTARLALTP